MYVSAMFPTKETLVKQYPYVHKYPILMPWAWLHRLIFRGSRAVKKGALTSYIVTDESKVSAAGKDRVQMFRKLKMLDN